VGLGAGLDGSGKIHAHWDSIPRLSSLEQVTELCWPTHVCVYIYIYIYITYFYNHYWPYYDNTDDLIY
jgi:hypothetical protein